MFELLLLTLLLLLLLILLSVFQWLSNWLFMIGGELLSDAFVFVPETPPPWEACLTWANPCTKKFRLEDFECKVLRTNLLKIIS